ncbi:MAG: transposase [Armatimonadetes bacterium]|nr:transposase [Armatimonadota bacterium]
MQKRTFDREFKVQVVRQLVTGEKKLSPLCREHALGAGWVRHGRGVYEPQGEAAWREAETAASVRPDPQARIAELEAALGRAHLDIEFLKRALEKKGSGPGSNGR